jgi:hypothetical protein
MTHINSLRTKSSCHKIENHTTKITMRFTLLLTALLASTAVARRSTGATPGAAPPLKKKVYINHWGQTYGWGLEPTCCLWTEEVEVEVEEKDPKKMKQVKRSKFSSNNALLLWQLPALAATCALTTNLLLHRLAVKKEEVPPPTKHGGWFGPKFDRHHMFEDVEAALDGLE